MRKRYKVPLWGSSPKLAHGWLPGDDSKVDYLFMYFYLVLNSTMSILSSFWFIDQTKPCLN